MGCSTFHGLDERVGAGEKKCTRAPNTEPTVWTVSALKTSQANLLGLTFRAPYALVPFVLASWSKFSLQRCFSQLTPCWCLPLSKFSINISSLFLHTSFNTLPSPLHSIPLMLLPLPHLPIELGQSEPPSCKTPVLKAKKKNKNGKVERVGSNPRACCAMLGQSLNISGLDQMVSKSCPVLTVSFESPSLISRFPLIHSFI